ncbi:MAG: LacI family DNA-binding transcriptional regulator [Planctomycetes bacterium]|nr:LacI family DNA-binding transcriptional regulator [Planctomycetota bacterium]
MRTPTLRDVARACRVSPATVSKALSPHEDRCDVSAATREKVRAAARRMGFAPSPSHARRTRRLWRNIGLLWGRFAPFTTGVYHGVLDAIGGRLADRGWRLLYTPVTSSDAWHEMQMAQRLDGVIAVSHVPDAVLEALVRAHYPAVLLNLRTSLPLPQFLPDEAAGMRELAGHLAALGHRRVLYMPHRDHGVGHFSESERRTLLHGECARHGMSVADVAAGRIDAAIAACRAGATAVVCYDWSDAPALVATLQAAGMPVPGRVSVACCSDLHWFDLLTPPLTALDIPVRALAETAADSLLAQIDGAAAPAAPVLLPTRLRIRGTTGPVTKPRAKTASRR